MLKHAALTGLLFGSAKATCHCPTGASCDNGTVVNRDDYWADPDELHFHKCVPPAASLIPVRAGLFSRMCAVHGDPTRPSRFGPSPADQQRDSTRSPIWFTTSSVAFMLSTN